jgi:hypothetical protein
MTIKERDIKNNLLSFTKTNQESDVVKSDDTNFKNCMKKVIFGNEIIIDSDLYFNDSTIRKKITFGDYVKLDNIAQLIENVIGNIDKIITTTEEFLNDVDAIIEQGVYMDDTLRTNHSHTLKKILLDESINIVRLDKEHIYLSNRLSVELKKSLVNKSIEFTAQKQYLYQLIKEDLN